MNKPIYFMEERRLGKQNKKKKYVMFIDETGAADINNKEQPFALTGVIFEYKYCMDLDRNTSELKTKLNKLKQDCFGKTDVDLHLEHISRGKGQFKIVPEVQREKFYNELPDFLKSLDFHIISVTVDKEKLQSYYEPSKDPYVVGFTYVLQSFYSFISNPMVESARIVIESRDDNENLYVQKAFFDVFNNGTIHFNFEEHKKKIKGFIIANKTDEFYQSGLEIADIVCNPVSRVRRGLVEVNTKFMHYGKENKIFKAIKDKIYTTSDLTDIRNWGFKKVPVLKKKRVWIDDPMEKVK